ncbi:MAG: PEP-CTERM sorting domain-containing protein [Deltaproteobacteria bacterium]|nr:PEP-CTERM sorting domain-containing protein [Deltaproteobacteria bacterium]MBW1951363.1 PEP-CTERM sorting domain-containing protein [Deltaproteobacteria bacterium]MBW2007217.1 PEP-CTERM sorting domain-containing protein [Deltaproteobacteria bacterium]
MVRKTISLFVVILSLGLVLLASSPVLAAPFTIEITGLPNPSGIGGFTFWFDVSDDFDLLSDRNFGSGIPGDGSFGWAFDANQVVGSQGARLFKVGAFDQDGLYLDDPHNLQDGILLQFEYAGEIYEAKKIEFSNYAGDTSGPSDFNLSASLSPSGLLISSSTTVIPIPSTVLLLGSGLFGLVALRRKRS